MRTQIFFKASQTFGSSTIVVGIEVIKQKMVITWLLQIMEETILVEN